MVRLYDAVQALETLYPLQLAESWDYPGLIVGNLDANVRAVACVSDPTLAMVQQACEEGIDLLITHHPLFFRSVHEVSGSGVRGEIVRILHEAHCALWVGHTNADAAWRGVADAAAEAFGLINCVPLVPTADTQEQHPVGLGRLGMLAQSLSLKEFAHRVYNALPHTELGIQVCGDLETPVTRIAVLPGSGDSLFDVVRACKADVYVTSDLRHHPATDAIEQARYEYRLRSQLHNADTTHDMIRPMLINTPHSAIESLWFNYAMEDIPQKIYELTGEQITMRWLQHACDPWNYSIH